MHVNRIAMPCSRSAALNPPASAHSNLNMAELCNIRQGKVCLSWMRIERYFGSWRKEPSIYLNLNDTKPHQSSAVTKKRPVINMNKDVNTLFLQNVRLGMSASTSRIGRRRMILSLNASIRNSPRFQCTSFTRSTGTKPSISGPVPHRYQRQKETYIRINLTGTKLRHQPRLQVARNRITNCHMPWLTVILRACCGV